MLADHHRRIKMKLIPIDNWVLLPSDMTGEKEMPEKATALTKTETELFVTINQTLEESSSLRWSELVELRDSEQLTDDQRAELIQLGNEIESLNMRRFQAIHELAKLRDVEFSELCQQLQIVPS